MGFFIFIVSESKIEGSICKKRQIIDPDHTVRVQNVDGEDFAEVIFTSEPPLPQEEIILAAGRPGTSR